MFVIDGPDEPRTVKAVQETPLEHEALDVAMLPKVLTPVKYGMLPMTAAVDVERPLKPSVAPERVMGQFTDMSDW